MDLKKLQYFAAVAECGSFTKASAQLHVAQPALSRQIALLEEEFGVKLLLRMGRHVRLTDAGEVLLRYAHEITKSFQAARDEMNSRGRKPRGRVVFGAPPSLGSVVVPLLFERLRSDGADITLQVREGNTAFLDRSIVDAEIDLALLGEESAGEWTEGKTLFQEDFALIGRRDLIEDIARRRSSAFADIPLFATRQVNQLWQRVLREKEPPEPLEFDAIHGIKKLTLDGRGVAVTPVGLFSADIVAGHVAVARIAEFDVSRPLVIAWSSVRPQSRALEVVIATLEEELSGLADAGVFSIPAAAPVISVAGGAAGRAGGLSAGGTPASTGF